MDHSFASYHYTLAQMPTDQQEDEEEQPVQTGVSHAEGILQNPSQPYSYPCSLGEHWATFRSPMMPESSITYQYPGYAGNAWDATGQQTYGSSLDHLAHNPVHENIHLTPIYSAPQSTASSVIATTNTMDNNNQLSFSNDNQLSFSNVQRVDHNSLSDWQNQSVHSSYLTHDSFYQQPIKMETSDTKSLATHTGAASPLISISSRQSHPRSLDSMSPAASATTADGPSPLTSFGDASDQDSATEAPYSKLIWDCLMSARDPDYMMPLQDIYEWFEKNTSKGNDKTKGWQNSIRHNLSMNQGFEPFKEERPGKKTINYWRLTPEAILNGVQSTTRYRKANNRKTVASQKPIPSRQLSGSKGGRASGPAAKMRQSSQEEQHQESPLQSPTVYPLQQPHSQPFFENHSSTLPAPSTLPEYQSLHHPYAGHTFNGLPSSCPKDEDESVQSFGMGSVTDCTTLPPGENALFYDSVGTNPTYAPFNMGQYGWF